MKIPKGPFQLNRDDCGHWYVIPVRKSAAWTKWLDSDAAQDGDVPKWAVEVGGSYTLVQFDAYTIK